MREGWTTTTLGEVCDINPSTARHEADHVIRYIDLGSVNADSGIDPEAVTAVPFGDAPGRARRTVNEGDVLVATVRPYLRGFARVPPEFDGEVASTGFCVLRAKPNAALPGFIWGIVCTDAFVAGLMDRATGSNYPAVRAGDVAEYPILLPPPVDQRRIVDLLEAIDGAYSSAVRVAAGAIESRDRLLQDRLGAALRSRTTVGELAAARSGPSWKAADESSEERAGGLPVVKITNTRPEGDVVMDERAWVTGLPESTPVLEPHSLIVIRTNGNRDRIGNVYKATPEVVGHTVSAFQFALTPNSEEDSEFIFRFLQTPSVQREITESASGTTGLGNVAVRWLRALTLPDLTTDERSVVCETANDLDGVASAARNEADALLALRASLLDSLLSGEHEIPASYDELLERAS